VQLGNRMTAALALVLVVSLSIAADEPALLKMALFPAPMVRENVSLSAALAEVGARVTNGYVLFGIEVRVSDAEEPALNVNLKPGSTLGDALRQIFQQVPGYGFTVVSEHRIDVLPAGASRDPADLLNLRIPAFREVDVQPADILTHPDMFIPELRARLVPRRPGEPSGIFGTFVPGSGPASFDLRQVTIRQILNTASKETEKFPVGGQPLGWVCYFRPDPAAPSGGKYTWSLHFSAPRDWKRQEGGRKVK
jgi:hypothetical protein